MTDRDITEVWIVKNARAGASENVLLNPMRWAVANRPQPILYVSGQQQSVERFMEKRIKLGFGLARETAKKYRAARVREHEIFFPDMDLIATWPKNKMAFKQSGYPLILGDEISTWPEYSAEMLRMRTANWSFPTIIGISSPDPQQNRASDADPIFVEYWQTDCRKWFMADPATGRPFTFTMGFRDQETKLENPAGLKWDQGARRQDGTWDLDRVRDSAYYVTPDGTRIEEAQRWPLVMSGAWAPTREGRAGKRGYHINAFYMPWFSFGEIAVSFLEANAKGGRQLRAWLYEWLAEPWREKVESLALDIFEDNRGEYYHGENWTTRPGYAEIYQDAGAIPIMTVDVQLNHFWYVVRVWAPDGSSGLLAYGQAETWAEVDKISRDYGTYAVFVDSGDGKRTFEVYGACAEYDLIPTKGSAGKLNQPYVERSINPELGRAVGHYQLPLIVFDADVFKDILTEMIKGTRPQPWLIPKDAGRDYTGQMVTEERTDAGWRPVKSHADNHLWDCEVMQAVAAARLGFLGQV